MRVEGFGFRVQGSGFRVSGFGFGFRGLGDARPDENGEGSGVRLCNLGLRVGTRRPWEEGLRFRVQGVGVRVEG